MKVKATSSNDSFMKISNFKRQMAGLYKNSLDIYKAKKTLESYKSGPFDFISKA